MNEQKPRSLTRRQQSILRFIIRYKEDSGGDSPTHKEIMRACSITSSSIVAHNLLALEKRGYIFRPPGAFRCIAVTGGRWVYEAPQQEVA